MLDLVTQTLRDVLERGTPDIANSWVRVHSLSGDVRDPEPNKLVLFLYAVHEHDHLRNQALVHDPAGYRRAPLALRLRYLVTYVSDNHDEDQKRLSRVLEVFHTRPRLEVNDVHPDLVGRVAALSVRLLNPGPEEVNQIWTALNRGLRLALYYQVDVALIEPVDPDHTPPVSEVEGSVTELDPAGAPS